MNDTVLAETLRDWSQEAEVPHDLAHRVLARRQARRRRLVLPAVAGLATAAVVVAALVVGGTVGPVSTHDGPPAAGGLNDVHADTTHNPPQEVVLAGDVAVSAIVTYTRVPAPPDGWQTLQRRYAVANPTTGRYEPRSWTYAAVAPGLATAAMLEGPLPSSQVGFVDLATGKVTRWVAARPPGRLAGLVAGRLARWLRRRTTVIRIWRSPRAMARSGWGTRSAPASSWSIPRRGPRRSPRCRTGR